MYSARSLWPSSSSSIPQIYPATTALALGKDSQASTCLRSVGFTRRHHTHRCFWYFLSDVPCFLVSVPSLALQIMRFLTTPISNQFNSAHIQEKQVSHGISNSIYNLSNLSSLFMEIQAALRVGTPKVSTSPKGLLSCRPNMCLVGCHGFNLALFSSVSKLTKTGGLDVSEPENSRVARQQTYQRFLDFRTYCIQ